MIKLIAFEPKSLNNVLLELENDFPLPIDLALKDDSKAIVILENIRRNNSSLTSLSVNELYSIYHISKICTQEEFNIIKSAFDSMMTSILFHIGWPYCQMNPNDKRATTLFIIACNWMKKNSPYEFSKSLVYRAGLVWDEMYSKAIDYMLRENQTFDDFCTNYSVLSNSTFYQQLKLIYYSKCDKATLRQNEAQLAELIVNSNIDFLRPALINYSSKLYFDEMSLLMKEAIIERLSDENSDNFIGLSPDLVSQVRQKRYSIILSKNLNQNPSKLNVYNSISGKINNIVFYNNGFFTIDFGSLVVVDNSEWNINAYAFYPKIFKKLLEDWTSKDFPDNYWPVIDKSEIVFAREVILGLNKSSVIEIEFDEFNILYTKDLLTSPRYANN